MRKIVFIVVSFLFVPVIHAADYTVPGMLHLTDGSKMKCEDIRLYDYHYNKGGIAVRSGYYQSTTHSFSLQKADDNRKIKLDDKDIQKISLLDYGKSWAKGTMMEVQLKNGNSASMLVFKDSRVDSLGSKIYVKCKDEFTGQTQEQTLYWGLKNSKKDPKVISITLGESGNIKWSEGTNRYFPVGFKYDPYTGERLILKDTTAK